MAQPDDSWRTQAFRQSVVAKIEEAIKNSGTPTSKNSIEMENHVFQKAKNKEEYLGFVARLILHVREMNAKKGVPGMPQGAGGGQGMPDPMSALQTLARQGTGNAQVMGMQGGPNPQGMVQQQQQGNTAANHIYIGRNRGSPFDRPNIPGHGGFLNFPKSEPDFLLNDQASTFGTDYSFCPNFGYLPRIPHLNQSNPIINNVRMPADELSGNMTRMRISERRRGRNQKEFESPGNQNVTLKNRIEDMETFMSVTTKLQDEKFNELLKAHATLEAKCDRLENEIKILRTQLENRPPLNSVKSEPNPFEVECKLEDFEM